MGVVVLAAAAAVAAVHTQVAQASLLHDSTADHLVLVPFAAAVVLWQQQEQQQPCDRQQGLPSAYVLVHMAHVGLVVLA